MSCELKPCSSIKMSAEAKKNCRDLESLLQQSFGKDVTVLSCSNENLLSVGENFASDMIKISVKLKRTKDSPVEDHDFVAKKILAEVDDFGDWTTVIEREIFMYTDIIPLYSRIEVENGVDKRETAKEMVATLYGHRIVLDPKTKMAGNGSLILFDNLKLKGFYIADKKVGLDLEHAKAATELLARFDALGIVAKKRYPSDFQKIKSVAENQGVYNVQGSADLRSNIVSMVTRRFPKYTAILEDINSRHKNNLNYELVRNDTWSSVCHNDFWTNNIMFRKDQRGRVDGVKFVDFQSYSYSNIFVEIPYFFFTSLDDKAKLDHLDELLDLYYGVLIGTLRKMNVDTGEFSRREFDKQLAKDAVHELVHIMVDLLHFTADAEDAEDRDDLLKKIATFQGNELFYKKVGDLLRIYELKNWLY